VIPNQEAVKMKISRISLNGNKRGKQIARECMAHHYDPLARKEQFGPLMESLGTVSVRDIDRALKHGRSLTMEEAFCGMAYVIAATNLRFYELFHCQLADLYGSNLSPEHIIAIGTAFLQVMAAKETYRGLTPEEVAGLAAASMMDTIFQIDFSEVIETCGMGGDKGFSHNGFGKKTINASTLSAIVLNALGEPVIKHGSYANTSAVGSTEAIELFGARTDMGSMEDVERIWERSGFCFLDAHWCKTIHDLSHLLMMETINHVVGPMSPPITPYTRIHRLMGVNEKVHPSVIARAYAILHQRGIQSVGGVAVVGGLDRYISEVNVDDVEIFREHCVLDELSPIASVVSIAHEGNYRGSFLVTPHCFGIGIDPEQVLVKNKSEAIQTANARALKGEDKNLSAYLAMNAAMGLFAKRHAGCDTAFLERRINPEYLQLCYQECHEAIMSGRAWQALVAYVEASGGKMSYF